MRRGGWSATAGLPHRPISERDDRCGRRMRSAGARVCGALHSARCLPHHRFRSSCPAPASAAARPLATLRYAVACVAGGWAGRWRAAIPGAAGLGLRQRRRRRRLRVLDAWIDPPPYTGLPPVYLRSAMYQDDRSSRGFGADPARPWRAALPQLRSAAGQPRPALPARTRIFQRQDHARRTRQVSGRRPCHRQLAHPGDARRSRLHRLHRNRPAAPSARL